MINLNTLCLNKTRAFPASLAYHNNLNRTYSFPASSSTYHNNLNKTRAFSTSTFYNSNLKNFKPVIVYANSDLQKLQVIQENKGKCRIYR